MDNVCRDDSTDESAILRLVCRFFFWDFVSGVGGGAPGTMRRVVVVSMLEYHDQVAAVKKKIELTMRSVKKKRFNY